jgi:pimeloyl-ACP methyl ester carboxylesterase
MTPEAFHAARKTIATPSGEIAYIEHGAGPAALFVHGFPVNAYHWRHVLAAVGDLRRCIAPDLMGLGYTNAAADQDLGFEAQADMLLEVLDALDLEQIDLVGNDSGGAIAQILATLAPERIRSLTLTNCDTSGHWPPPALAPIAGLAKAGQLGATCAAFLANPELARSPGALGAVFEFPARLSPELLDVYLGPLTASEKRRAQVDAYVVAIEQGPPDRLAAGLQALQTPTLIVWADDDIFFPVSEGRWLAETIPGTRTFEALEGAKLFFPEERPDPFCALLRRHWTATR